MKKLKKLMILLGVALLPIVAAATTGTGGVLLGDAQGATTETGTLIGTLMFIVVVAVWMLPLVFGVMVYSSQKKKAEQQHEDVGIKTAISSLVAIIIGAAAAFYIVGSIGQLADPTATDLKKGNSFFLAPLFGKAVNNI